eukprot:jgi/Orpsp1_1/1185897/evm.model.c7180000095906.1
MNSNSLLNNNYDNNFLSMNNNQNIPNNNILGNGNPNNIYNLDSENNGYVSHYRYTPTINMDVSKNGDDDNEKVTKIKIRGWKLNLNIVKALTISIGACSTITDLTYKYIVDDISEDFTRTLDEDETTTHNEFFGRKYTVKKLPQFPTVYKWNKSVGKGELFDDSYIPTVHISGDRSEKLFTTSKASADYIEKIDFILKDSVYSFK